MTPNVRGLGAALARMKHDLDLQAQEALGQLSALGDRAAAAMVLAKRKIAETRVAVEEIEAFVADEGSNGAPASSVSSDASGQPQPGAEGVAAAPEQLTVNGVSAG